MRLLFITEFFPYGSNLVFSGGVEAYSYYLIKRLAKRHEVTVICRKKAKNYKTIIKNINVIPIGPLSKRIDTSVVTIPARLLFIFLCIKFGLGEKFDLVQGNNFITYIPAFIIGLIKRRPTVAWYPDVFLGRWIKLTNFFSGIAGEAAERFILSLPWTQFVALSDSTKTKLIKAGVKSSKITKIYAGVDKPGKTIKKDKIFRIICVSRLVKYKRIDALIDAAKILVKQGWVLKLLIVGDGPEYENLLQQIRKNNLERYATIEFRLARNVLWRKLKQSHVFCLPSEIEGFGLTIIEAAACGVPFVARDIPVLREITHSKGGLFFKNTNQLVTQLSKIMDDRAWLTRLSGDALELSKEYRWERITREFEDVYQRILKKVKVVMFIDAWFPRVGGGQIHVWELSKKLVRSDFNVTIFTRNLGLWTNPEQDLKVIRIGRVKKFENIFGRLEYMFNSLFFLLIHKFDIVHLHAFSPGLLFPFVKIFRNQQAVFTLHGKGDKIAGLGFGERFLEDLVVYRIPYDLLISVARNSISKKPAAKRVSIIPNGVDIERFQSAWRQREKIKNILCVSRLSYEKGVDLLINAFSRLKRPKLSLTIVGEGRERSTLEKTNTNKQITFKGLLTNEQLVSEYRNADLVVLPSRTEGLPLVLFESWAAKVPILATRVGDNPVYIRDGVNGFLSEPTSAGIYSALNNIIGLNGFNQIVKEGINSVQNLTWEKIAKRTIRLYNYLLNV